MVRSAPARDEDQRVDAAFGEQRLERTHEPVVDALRVRAKCEGRAALERAAQLADLGVEGRRDPRRRSAATSRPPSPRSARAGRRARSGRRRARRESSSAATLLLGFETRIAEVVAQLGGRADSSASRASRSTASRAAASSRLLRVLQERVDQLVEQYDRVRDLRRSRALLHPDRACAVSPPPAADPRARLRSDLAGAAGARAPTASGRARPARRSRRPGTAPGAAATRPPPRGRSRDTDCPRDPGRTSRAARRRPARASSAASRYARAICAESAGSPICSSVRAAWTATSIRSEVGSSRADEISSTSAFRNAAESRPGAPAASRSAWARARASPAASPAALACSARAFQSIGCAGPGNGVQSSCARAPGASARSDPSATHCSRCRTGRTFQPDRAPGEVR